jgi:hypothetical protein
MNQYPYMTDLSGIGGGMQDTRSQDALHQALLLKTMEMNPQVQHNQQNMNGLAQALRQGNKTPSDPSNINPATGQDWSTTGSGYAGNGSYGTGGIDAYLNGTSGIDNSALGDYNLSGMGANDLSSLAGNSGLSSIGDYLASLFGSGGAAAGASTAIEEAAPLVLAAL